ncbi:hypothetical protein GGR88_000480 [Sphingomonas jejuensis]|uniref:EF-hand domain-containing protein n=1 Tax=Sphingomonas jejuensis TaxID=904715 RepID=A0ABX0XJU3_9SPHN|nr:EF-hand domain-containing protein [Sphingomonas jejuensis]NJC33006.1 hypothetical protein [Sphingomonas jejuensis]
MIKALLLSATMMAASPVMAQETAPQPQSTPPAEQAAPADTLPAQPETAAEDVVTSEAAPAAETATTEAATAEAATTNSADTVAQVVEAEFANYDGDADGELTQAEFGRWMTALRASQPGGAAEGDSASWANAAFAQADTDSNSKVSRGELTTFLQG